jgi:hypothetical protein
MPIAYVSRTVGVDHHGESWGAQALTMHSQLGGSGRLGRGERLLSQLCGVKGAAGSAAVGRVYHDATGGVPH